MKLMFFRGHTLNFGDDLNEDIWPALAPELFDGDDTDGFSGIGTVIGMPMPPSRTLHVLGSGMGNHPLSRWSTRDVRFWCVRGPVTAKLAGLDASMAITDGAILTPLVDGFPKAATGGGGTVMVPHHESLDYPGWDEVAARTGYTLVDPRTPTRDVVAKLAAAELVLTESLHGAILADSYGVPWIAFSTLKTFSGTKWVDWTMSIGEELAVTRVPPPSFAAIATIGRGQGQYGVAAAHSVDQALRDFEERLAEWSVPGGPPKPMTAKQRMKRFVRQTPALHPLFGLNPARTAKALTALAKARPSLSKPGVRAELSERLQQRLAALQSEYHTRH